MKNILIESERLKVVMGYPGIDYSGSRFDWTGFITQVTLENLYDYCVDESLVPGIGTRGRGLCNEFGIHIPVGYDEVQAGQCFPKLGIGLLTKPADEPYHFFKPYFVKPFQFEVSANESEAVFTALPEDCNGYGVTYEKRIKVESNKLLIKYYLKNTGKKLIATNEYCHNFVSLNCKAIGPDYELKFSFIPAGDNVPEIFQVNGSSITWKYVPNQEFYWTPSGFENKGNAFWELTDKASGLGLREQCLFTPERVAIWGKQHVVSPEMFIKIYLEPGQEMEWGRHYEFYKANV